jgi:hypothetical protein
MRTGCFVVAIWLVSAATHAQTTYQKQDVNTGMVIGLEADHNGVNATGYKVYVDGALLSTLPASARTAAGVVPFTVPAMTRGVHVVEFTAFNLDTESDRAGVEATAKTPKPATPQNLRIVIRTVTAENGTLSFQIESVEPTD